MLNGPAQWPVAVSAGPSAMLGCAPVIAQIAETNGVTHALLYRLGEQLLGEPTEHVGIDGDFEVGFLAIACSGRHWIAKRRPRRQNGCTKNVVFYSWGLDSRLELQGSS